MNQLRIYRLAGKKASTTYFTTHWTWHLGSIPALLLPTQVPVQAPASSAAAQQSEAFQAKLLVALAAAEPFECSSPPARKS